MFPGQPAPQAFSATFLCLRRGVSRPRVTDRRESCFSLPTQRCFYICCRPSPPYCLFSAYAEVFLESMAAASFTSTFLCLRRGVSDLDDFVRQLVVFSLPTQRCFLSSCQSGIKSRLFSAYAEVFPLCSGAASRSQPFLCLRRGVSQILPGFERFPGFSLPTQRCFTLLGESAGLLGLFSAYAEVFPTASRLSERKAAFLCLRRGVSWRRTIYPNRRPLFSAYAEVFPCFLVSWVP